MLRGWVGVGYLPTTRITTDRAIAMRHTNRLTGGTPMSSLAVVPTARTPRVLFLSCHLPWPPLSGGRRRELELIKRASTRFDVHLLVVSKTPRADRARARQLLRWCRRVEVFPPTPYPIDAPEIDQPAQVVRHHCPAAADRVSEILASEPVELVHVEGFYLMQHVPARIAVPLLLVEQNVEYELERQSAQTVADRPSARSDAVTKRAELRAWQRATEVAAVTPEDRRTIERALHVPVRVIPDGADHLPQLRVIGAGDLGVAQVPRSLIVLLANFGYAPNVDAALHFCRDIFPAVRRRIADATVWLVGNAPPAEIRALEGSEVAVTGFVPDVIPYLDAAEVIVCPLRIGGGIKVKTIEALRRGKAIVSTSIGAQGLPRAARAALLLADDPHRFADGVASLLLDPRRRHALEQRAAQAAWQLPTWDDAARALTDLYDELLGQAAQPGERARAGAATGAGR